MEITGEGLFDVAGVYPKVREVSTDTRVIDYNPTQSSPPISVMIAPQLRKTCEEAKATGDSPYLGIYPGYLECTGRHYLFVSPGQVFTRPVGFDGWGSEGIRLSEAARIQLRPKYRPPPHAKDVNDETGELKDSVADTIKSDPYDLTDPRHPGYSAKLIPTFEGATGKFHEDIYLMADDQLHWRGHPTIPDRPLRPDEYPFSGSACFKGRPPVQGPCAAGSPANRENANWHLGTPDVPYKPWRDPDTKWYNHRVVHPRYDGGGNPSGHPEEASLPLDEVIGTPLPADPDDITSTPLAPFPGEDDSTDDNIVIITTDPPGSAPITPVNPTLTPGTPDRDTAKRMGLFALVAALAFFMGRGK